MRPVAWHAWVLCAALAAPTLALGQDTAGGAVPPSPPPAAPAWPPPAPTPPPAPAAPAVSPPPAASPPPAPPPAAAAPASPAPATAPSAAPAAVAGSAPATAPGASPAPASAPGASPAPATAPAETPPAARAPATVPPVMVAVLWGDRVPAALAVAVRSALVTQVRPMAGGRPVLGLEAEGLMATLTACAADAACLGREIAGAGAIGAVVARLSRARRATAVTLTLELLDPVSGAPRLPSASASLAEGADPAPVLAPLTEAFRAVMFSPPPAPPRVLVTTNVEGATVLVDGAEIGTTPLARFAVEPGRHTLTVTAAGYAASSHELDLGAGDERRIDVVLEPSSATRGGGGGGPMDEVIVGTGSRGPEIYEEWWFWTIVGGVVVAGVAIGVGVGVATNQPPPPVVLDPMGIRLPEIR